MPDPKIPVVPVDPILHPVKVQTGLLQSETDKLYQQGEKKVSPLNPTLKPVDEKKDNAVEMLDILKGVQFRGGVFTDREVDLIPSGGYSMIQNIRMMCPGFCKRKGCRKLHTDADGTNRVVTLFQFSKGRITERHFYAQMSDGDILEATTAPPGVTTGAFGSEVHTNTSYASMLPASWAVVNDTMFYSDGTSAAMVYSGNNQPVVGFIVYKGAAAIPVIPKMGADYTNQVTDGDTTTYADLASLSVLTDYDSIFIHTPTPPKAFNFVMSSANVTASVAQIHYWNGAWTAVSGFSDGTSLSSAAFGQDGTMSFTMTTDHVSHYMFGDSGYWTRISLASGALHADTKISACTYNSDWTKIQNVWDGVPVASIESYVYTAADGTYSFYSSTSVSLDALTSSDKLYFNSPEPLVGAYFSVGAFPNANAAALTVKYWNGTAFSATSNSSDATTESTVSLASDGWVTWDHPADEQPSMFRSSQYFSYWYEFSWSATLSDDVAVSIETMPYLSLADYGNAIAVAPFKQRVAYSFDKVPGYIVISASNMPMTFNGDDYALQEIGDGRANKAICMRNFFSELMVWQEEKGPNGGCLTMVQGYGPDTYGKMLISSRYGTLNAKSAVVVEGVNMGTSKDRPIVNMAFFISHHGVFGCDGTVVMRISKLENSSIQNYFDPTKDECIKSGEEDKMWMAYDSKYNCLRLGLVSGASATECNIFPIFDLTDLVWSFDSHKYPFSCALDIESGSGAVDIVHISGGTADGTVYQSNYGTDDVSTAVDSYATMELDAVGAEMLMREFVIRKTGSLTVTPYVDGVAQDAITVS